MPTLIEELYKTVVAGIQSRMPNRQARIARARDWIKCNFEPSTHARRSVYSLKHVFERSDGHTYIRESEFAEALRLEGFSILSSRNGDRVYAKIPREVVD